MAVFRIYSSAGTLILDAGTSSPMLIICRAVRYHVFLFCHRRLLFLTFQLIYNPYACFPWTRRLPTQQVGPCLDMKSSEMQGSPVACFCISTIFNTLFIHMANGVMGMSWGYANYWKTNFIKEPLASLALVPLQDAETFKRSLQLYGLTRAPTENTQTTVRLEASAFNNIRQAWSQHFCIFFHLSITAARWSKARLGKACLEKFVSITALLHPPFLCLLFIRHRAPHQESRSEHTP